MSLRTRRKVETWLAERWRRPTPELGVRLLQPLAWLYAALAGGHRALYTSGLRPTLHAPRPVLVVGNLVAGGAGKTPTVLALLPLLQAMGHRPGVISRGHGRDAGGVVLVGRDSDPRMVGDEPLLIHLRSDVPVAVGADRVAAAHALCRQHPELTVLVADDGLQHHRLARDLALWVFDDRGIGNGLRLPAGPLRQPLPAAVPPNTLVVYSGGRQSTPLPGFIGRRLLAGLWPLADWWLGSAQPAELAALRDRRVLAAAGLANPEGFFAMLEGLGLALDRLPLPDHARLDPLPWPPGTADVVVTEKDAVKLRPERVGGTRVWVARLQFDIEPAFTDALRAACAGFATIAK